MNSASSRLALLAVTAVSAAALSGCSGNGGSSSTAGLPLEVQASLGLAPEIRTQLREAAGESPVLVSYQTYATVNQSESDPSLSFTARQDDNGNVHFAGVHLGTGDTFDTETQISATKVIGDPPTGFAGRSATVRHTGTNSELETVLDLYTDIERKDDTDYLTGGLWLSVERLTDGTGDVNYDVGAFAGGNDPFTQANVMGLTGDATYQGVATGVYEDNDDGTGTFDATATLTAQFGDVSTLGTISGTVSDFTEDGAQFAENPALTLGSTSITAMGDGGFFAGATSMTLNSTAYTGNWGGSFFGNGTDPTDNPGSVAGTFGAAASDGSGSLLGFFGAYKQ